jgi:hypothetical protein
VGPRLKNLPTFEWQTLTFRESTKPDGWRPMRDPGALGLRPGSFSLVGAVELATLTVPISPSGGQRFPTFSLPASL